MNLDAASLGAFGSLAHAIGLTDGSAANGAWFGDPLGGSSGNLHGLKTVLSDDDQRQALESFVDEVLGPPDAHTDAEGQWVPLFHETSPDITVYAVLQPVAGAVYVGVGLDHTAGSGSTRVTTSVHVPVFQVARGGTDGRDTSGPLPHWLVLGRDAGRVDVSVDATFEPGPPTPGEAFLSGAAVHLAIPTSATGTAGFSLTLKDLQLPGATHPTTQTLDVTALSELGPDVFAFVTGILRQQIESLDLTNNGFRHIRGLAGVVGLRDVPDLPALPLADLPVHGLPALVSWVESVIGNSQALTAWLGALADLVGGSPVPARNAVRFAIGPASLLLGVRVTPGAGGHSVLVPRVELTWSPGAGVDLTAAVDLLRADTATGRVTAVPSVQALAVLGAAATGGSTLLSGNPGVGTVRVGLGLDEVQRPTFILTAHDVDLPGPNHFDDLDLSSPQAALNAASSVIDTALGNALDGFGAAGTLLKEILGIQPPAPISAIAITDLLADPLVALRGYWLALSGNASAMSQVLATVRQLLTGVTAAVTGSGTAVAPWVVDLTSGVAFRVWRDGSLLVVAIAADVATGIPGDLQVATHAELSLLQLDLNAGHASFAASAHGDLLIQPAGPSPMTLDLGVATLVFTGVGVRAQWAAGQGLHAVVLGDGLRISYLDPHTLTTATHDIPLPVVAADGTVTFAPDWDVVEAIATGLLNRLDSPVLTTLLDLVGWRGTGAHLRLAELVSSPTTAVGTWATQLALDCAHLRAVLGPVAWLLSGGQLLAPLGGGRPGLPYRAPVAGNPRAPGLTAWTVPGCAPLGLGWSDDPGRVNDLLAGLATPTPQDMAASLAALYGAIPDLDDLLVGRPHLADGLATVITRWTGTDGVVAPATTMPSEVPSLVLDGFAYAELVACGRLGLRVLEGVAEPLDTVVHVGTTSDWLTTAPAGQAIDATVATPASLAATVTGSWYVQVPTVAAAAAGRSDHDRVAGQAAALTAVLAARTAPVVVVAYGDAAAAAVRAAASQPQVSSVVTVGAPWSTLSVTALQSGLGGDALRFLDRIYPDALPAADDTAVAYAAGAVRRGWSMVQRGIQTTDPGMIPNAAAEARRTGLAVYAVFGSMSADDSAQAMAALVAAGVQVRGQDATATALAAAGVPTELHVGVDLPCLELDLGGVFVGAGVAVDLVSVNATAPTIRPLREVVTRLEFGVTDGWLVGGPGAAQRDLEVRWVDALVHVPLDGRPGWTQLVLHEARAYAAFREQWVVTVDGSNGSTTALPEVKILLSEVATRLQAASPDLATLLTALGILRNGGLDPDAVDHLLHDPVTMLRPRVTTYAADIASALRAMVGLPTTGLAATAFRVGVAGATIDVDLAAASLTGSVTMANAPLPPMSFDLAVSPSAVTAIGAFGVIATDVGGLRLVGHAGTGGASLSVEHRAPGAAATTTIGVYPTVASNDLVRLATTVLPAVVMQAVGQYLRTGISDTATTLVDAAFDALGLLSPPATNGGRDLMLPIGLVADPGAWLRLRADPFGAVVTVLDALVPIVCPTRPNGAIGWPLSEELTVTYAVVSGHLQLGTALTLATSVDGRAVSAVVTGGVSIAPTGTLGPTLDALVTVDQTGLHLALTPSPVLDLVRQPPAAAIRLYPPGAGIGAAAGAAAESAIRVLLNLLIDHRNDATATPVRAIGRAIHELGDGLGMLVTDHFTDGTIDAFAASPATTLLARLPYLVSGGLSALASAIDPSGTKVVVAAASGGARRISFGTGGHIHLDLDGTTPALDFGSDVEVFDQAHTSMGHVVLEHLRLTPTGIQVDLRAGPFTIDAGPVTLYPLVVARAGVTTGTFTRRIGVGLALDPAGASSVEVRWTLDGNPPAPYEVARDVTGVETSADSTLSVVGLDALGLAVSLASNVITTQLGTVVTARATGMLQGVVFTGGGRTIDTTLFADLTSPERLLHRLKMLAWNCATDPAHGGQSARPVSVTIDGIVTIGLAAVDLGGGQRHVGLNLTLPPGKQLDFPTSGVSVSLVVDASWVDPAAQPGLSILALKGPDADHLNLVLGFSVSGVGMRFRKQSGPLLELGSISLDGISFLVYAEAGPAGAGGGAKIQLDGLAVAPGGGGDTGVANKIMNDVGSASASNRPTFSPSLAIQMHPPPNDALNFTLRAGDPPGPWWLVIQRQLGPLYVDRIGLNTVEAPGKVTEISLLFTGQLSIFGLTAAVDQLMITWHGGDVLSITSWSVDLMGLAISADMSGASLAGGLLKTIDGGSTSYVGMLLGRFAAYGLSVFGGYTDDGKGHASFFIFGAINGPIGGPPAFFLTGLGGGLGINRGLVIPTDLSQFGTYPFIQALDPAAKPPAKPMDELHRLSEYFPHQMGDFWFAAGVSFTCFSLVDGVAVVAVSFGNGLEIDLLGLARLALPRPGAALVSIELGLLAHFSTSEGVFLIKAQLTDNSWLLYPEIRLTGGFAFAIWWKGPNAGQFVLTMGGYHPSFHRDGYPDVPRLGIMWRISDSLVIKGTSYFALTSEALMAGVGVEASLDFGWVWAKLSFGADGIVYFDPFWFEVSTFLRISAGINLDLGLFSISFSATLGASIKVWGPDFAGHAEFEMGPATVPIDFGSPHKVDPKKLRWDEFVAKYLEDAGGSARALSAITGRGSLPTKTGGQTGAPSADGTEALPYQVYAEFELTFTTTIPTATFAVGATPQQQVALVQSNGQPTALGLSPMGAHDLQSTLSIALEMYDAPTRTYVGFSSALALLTAGFGTGPGRPGYSTDNYPLGVWGLPGDPSIPVKPLPQGDVVAAGKQLVLVAGVDAPQVGPDIDYFQVTADRRPLPLLATGNARRDFLNVAAGLPGVTPTSAADALTLAAQTLFATRTIDGVATARGGHSALAAAAYQLDRSAPPVFGTLTDGLAKANGASGDRTELPAPTGPSARELRAPFVTGYFTAGAGAVARAAGTSVADGRLKRRAAPTVESVRGRMALHLPTAVLGRAATPTVATSGTVLSSAEPPRTETPGTMRSYVGARVGAPALQGVVGGLTTGWAPQAVSRRMRARRAALADAMGSTVRSGDVVVLQLPDAAFDIDADNRPSVVISGRARVTAVLGRTVLADTVGTDESVVVPRLASHVAVQADGVLAPTDGYAGWHARSRAARVGTQAAVAAGCVLSVDAAGSGPMMEWDTAGAVVHEAIEVRTVFAAPASTVLVALTGTTSRSLVPTQLMLADARVAADSSGADLPPTAVTLGATSVLVYRVVPDPGATSITVTVTAGGGWVVSGVAATNDTVSGAVALVAKQQLSGAIGKVLATSGPGCSVDWVPASARAPRRNRAAARATTTRAAQGRGTSRGRTRKAGR